MVKVKNLTNPKTGRAVANQFVIYDSESGEHIFQSYDSLICRVSHIKNTITFYPDWSYSKTTIRHLNRFICEYTMIQECSSNLIRKWIKEGQVGCEATIYKVIYSEVTE